jgi:hypothetical protein
MEKSEQDLVFREKSLILMGFVKTVETLVREPSRGSLFLCPRVKNSI